MTPERARPTPHVAPSSPAPSVVDLVRRRADTQPERVCLTFHEGDRAERITYGALVRQAAGYACLFRARGLRAGEAIVLLAPTAAAFPAALLGAQEAGLLAVPCPPRTGLESGAHVSRRVAQIFDRCGARAVFDPVPGPPDDDLAAFLAGHAGIRLTPADLEPPGGGAGRADSGPGRFPYAYCQFSSGSGGRAKGVLLTHENVFANIQAQAEAFGLRADRDVAVSWLPLFHDMGLVSYVLMPLTLGYPGHLMTPSAFLRDPRAWLELVTRVRGTVASAPDFAYALCTRTVAADAVDGLDLSSWRAAFDGAEPVTRVAVEGFSARFARAGFSRSALLPAYGLAEDTLCVAARRPGTGPRFETVSAEDLEARRLARPARDGEPATVMASVGPPLPGHDLAILDDGGGRLGEHRVGEIAIRGPSVMAGYLAGTSDEAGLRPDGWLLTGDLGYLSGGELFIAGRKKDLLIRAGRNYFPQDLEGAAARVPGVRAGRVAAFAVPGEAGEAIVVAAECRPDPGRDPDALRTAVRRAVFEAVRFAPDDVVLLEPHAIPITTSGKLMRTDARRLYLAEWRARG